MEDEAAPDNIVELTRGWVTTKMLCRCLHRWTAVHPVECTELECPNCETMVPV